MHPLFTPKTDRQRLLFNLAWVTFKTVVSRYGYHPAPSNFLQPCTPLEQPLKVVWNGYLVCPS